MELRTRKNGGKSTPAEVAADWHRQEHHFEWSHANSDEWAVVLAKKLKQDHEQEGEAHPDPRNIHH